MPYLFEKPKYLDYFGLKEAPYTTNPDERYLFLTENHQEAINMCGHIIENREGAGLIVGEQGTGKTTIMRRIASFLNGRPEFQIAIVETAEHSPTLFQLTKEILESFGEVCKGRDTQTRIDHLKAFLIASDKVQRTPILLIDEAQQMPARLMESLRGFLNFETPQGGKMLQIILFAMPNINKRLPFAPSFRNRLIKTEMRKMNRIEVEQMLRWRFEQAGGNEFPFTRDVLDTLFELSKGNPRTLCGIAQMALQIAATRGQSISPQLIKEVSERRYV